MKTRNNRLLAFLLSLAMVVTLVFGSSGLGVLYVSAAMQEYKVDFTTVSSAGFGDKGAISEGTTFGDGYFKVVGKVTARVDEGKDTLKCVEVAKEQGGAIQFTTGSTSNVKFGASSTGGSNESEIALLDVTTGKLVLEDSEIPTSSSSDAVTSHLTVTGTARVEFSFSNLGAGTYQILTPSTARNTRIFDVTVEETNGEARPDRADWSTVAAPVIDSATAENGKITVNYTGLVGYDGADKITVQLLDSEGVVVDESSVASDSASSSVNFAPAQSGEYSVKAIASREGEVDKESAKVSVSFVLPLATPIISSATSVGGGSVKVIWREVAEADSYIVSYKEAGVEEYTETEATAETEKTVTGLSVGKTYSFAVVAVRGEEKSTLSEIEGIVVTEEAQSVWSFTSFGTNTTDDTTYNGYSGNLSADGKVTVWNTDTKGKLVPNSTDGISFYYTAISADENFTFSADVSIDEWKLTNGQEGFGIMAADAVSNSHTSFWNNSYMASVTKVEYAGNQGGNITMKLGVGAQEKIGVPAGFSAADGVPANFTSTMKTLDTTCIDMAAGTYNIVGNYTNTADLGTIDERTSFHLEIKRDNTGYTLTYSNPSTGEVLGTQRYYDLERDNLNTIDTEHIYVGLFASRSCKATFSNVSLETHDASLDPDAEEREIEYVEPSYKVLSASKTGTAEHTLQFYANADGALVIKDGDGNVIAEKDYDAATYAEQQVTLTKGENKFTFVFTPDANYRPDGASYKRLSSYDTVTLGHTVTYETLAEGTVSLYVSPSGTAQGKGTKESPLDIYTAVSYVQAGQTIVLAGGTYNLTSPVIINRGVDGTADNMIYMVADPDAEQRPVFDFGKVSTGLSIVGNYWYIQGLDVTHTSNGNRGILVAGKHCVLDQINTYENGNTGLQISRYLSTDERDMWPAYNLILNCTSYNNADAGYEDADGFAAKLTCGDGNVFDGCIAYNNADDGWDLYAKVETGSIGAVTIQNCVAYRNGYLLDGTDAGNGNGFKMGGESQYAGHRLINSISYDNKAKGIDSNSCPDNKVTNSTSFNNESYNVALYTNVAKYTDYEPNGIISFRVGTDVDEQLKPVSQDDSEIYKSTNYFWFNGASQNTEGVTVTEDWFVSLDTKGITPTRNADGTINMHGLLELTAAAPADAGARLSGKASTDISIPAYPSDTEEPSSEETTEATESSSEETTEATESSSEETTEATESSSEETTEATESSSEETTEATESSSEETTKAEETIESEQSGTDESDSTRETTVSPSNGANNGTNNSQSAGTGDSNPIALWIGLLVVACVLVGALFYLRKKNK